MSDFPYILGYPRSGNNWVNCALELYSGRSRIWRPGRGPITLPGVTLLFEERSPLWVASHDPDCPPVPQRWMIIVRNPVDTIYSYSKTRRILSREHMSEWVRQYAGEWAWHNYRWLRGASAVLRYEPLCRSPTELKVATDFLGLAWDERLAAYCLKKASREALAAAAPPWMKLYLNAQLVALDYQQGRDEFRALWSDTIMSAIGSTQAQIGLLSKPKKD
jgi:hypothetical protein